MRTFSSMPRILAATAFLGLAAAAPAYGGPAREAAAASPWTELHASRARLVASAAPAPGGVRLAGLQVAMDEGWKTYWRMPGDGGVPPYFDWSGSTNVAGVKVLYPAPKRMAEAGGEVIGYKGAVLFPIKVTPQDPARPVALKLAVELGICREICVPATAVFTLALPPAGKAKPAKAARSLPKDAVAAALERVPRPHAQRRPSDPELRKVAIVGNGGPGTRLSVAAAFPGGKGADVFIEAPDGLYVPMLRREERSTDGIVRFSTDLPDDLGRDLKGKSLTLTLVSKAGASEVRWKVPR